MRTGEEIDGAIIAHMKATAPIVSALGIEVREQSWQGTDFKYPALRVATDITPSNNNCSPEKVEAYIDVFSEQKSSLEAQHIAGLVETNFHRVPFTQNGLKFISSIVTKVSKPERSIYAWVARVTVEFLVN